MNEVEAINKLRQVTGLQRSTIKDLFKMGYIYNSSLDVMHAFVQKPNFRKPVRRNVSPIVTLQIEKDAENALIMLKELVAMYGYATISDFYELVGMTGTFIDDKWGWFDLDKAVVKPHNDGFTIDFPRVVEVYAAPKQKKSNAVTS